MKNYVLGIDIGSGSVKLTMLKHNGIVAASAGCEYPTIYPQVGWAEQDPESWCSAFSNALRAVLDKACAEPKEIAAIAIDAATHTAVLLDESCHPLSHAILWTDQRSGEEVAYLNEQYQDIILKETLHTPTTVWTLPQLMWIHKHNPGLWSRVRHIVFAKDYLRYRLTGKLATDHIDAAGSMFYDVPNDCWSESLCRLCGIKSEWLPPLLDPLEIAGNITSAAAQEFGLGEGTPVLTGTTDTAMEILAAGSVSVGHATIKLATAGRICVVSDAAKPSPFLFNYRHVVPGLWYPGTATSSCAASFRWFRDVLGRGAYSQIDMDVDKISLGSEGLIFHPHLQGELAPFNDPALRASYVGISSRHTNAHFARATMEGIAFSLRDCLPILAKKDLHMKQVRVIGGGAKSEVWRQIIADVLGVNLEKAVIDDSSFGAAILAAVGISWFDSYEQAVEKTIHIQSTTTFDAARHLQYEQWFQRYQLIDKVLAEVYHMD